MPRYRYDKDRDEVVEVGSTRTEAIARASAWSKPMKCEALAVDPEHIRFQK